MMSSTRALCGIFNTPKSEEHLIKTVRSLFPRARRVTLVDVCRTRWVERLGGLDRKAELLHPICAALQDMALNKDESGAVGKGLVANVWVMQVN